MEEKEQDLRNVNSQLKSQKEKIEEEVTKKPLIGEKKEINCLVEEYKSGTEIFQNKTKVNSFFKLEFNVIL